MDGGSPPQHCLYEGANKQMHFTGGALTGSTGIIDIVRSLSVFKFSLLALHQFSCFFLKNRQVFYWNYSALKNAELNKNLKIEQNEKELRQVNDH
jgi:hypothetical protein